MKKWKAIPSLALVALGLSLLIHTDIKATEPTLARLSFWVPPEHMAEFAATYEKMIAPVLQKRGLVESARRGQTPVRVERIVADQIYENPVGCP